MNRSNADEVNLQMPPVTEDNSSINRSITLRACVTTGSTSVVSLFCIGLMSGAAGGLLLGATAVTLLQSLELLADNRLLMDHFEKQTSHDQVHEVHISVLALTLSVFSSTLSLLVGICIGLSAYSLVIKKKGEAVMGKALALAGTVCLAGVTATGHILGLFLQRFLSIPLVHATIVLCFLYSANVTWGFLIIISLFDSFFTCMCVLLGVGGYIVMSCTDGFSLVAWITYVSRLLKIRLVLGAVLFPLLLMVKLFDKSHSLKLITTPLPLMLIICDVYKIAGQQIVSLQSPNFTNTSNVVVEAFFVGVLTSLLLMVTVGITLFKSWQKGGADKIWAAAAAASGGAVLTVIKAALPVLGPGPSIGALTGVAGAVGVSLSAAVAATDQYEQVVDHYGFVGRLGVTVGAAVGAILSSCAHSGLSGLFMGLCAATIPAGAFVKLPFSYSTTCGFYLFLISVVLILPLNTALYYIMSGASYIVYS